MTRIYEGIQIQCTCSPCTSFLPTPVLPTWAPPPTPPTPVHFPGSSLHVAISSRPQITDSYHTDLEPIARFMIIHAIMHTQQSEMDSGFTQPPTMPQPGYYFFHCFGHSTK